MDNCPNCEKSLKGNVFKRAVLLTPAETNVINAYLPDTERKAGFCSGCSTKTLEENKKKIKKEITEITETIKTTSNIIPVVSINNPHKWDYDVIEMVTGQSTAGTGALFELGTAITDAFGGQSNKYNKKIQDGEKRCSSQLRMKTLHLNANAVISTAVEYSEVGGDKGMLMVCMTGTAVKINNIEEVFKDKAENIQLLNKNVNRLRYLHKLNIN